MTAAARDADRIASRDIRNTLVIARQAQGLSLQTVADRIGISLQLLSKWEHAETSIPTVDSMARWAAALGYEIALMSKEAE